MCDIDLFIEIGLLQRIWSSNFTFGVLIVRFTVRDIFQTCVYSAFKLSVYQLELSHYFVYNICNLFTLDTIDISTLPLLLPKP